MIRHRSEEEVRHYDLLKLGVLLLLLALLTLAWFVTRDLQTAELTGDALPVATLPAEEAPGEAQPSQPAEPVVPVIDLPTGALTVGGVTLSGTAAPGSQIAILANDQPVGMATAGVDGSWAARVDLPPGDYAIRVQAVDSVGGIAGVSEPMAITVADDAAAAQANQPAPPSLNPPAEIRVDGESGEAVLPIPPGTITWTGQGQPGTRVEMLINGLRVGLTEVDPGGAWSLPVNMPVGNYLMQLNALDAMDVVLASTDPLRVEVGDVSGDVSGNAPATGETDASQAPAATIAEALAGMPGDYSILLSLLQASGLVESLPASGPFTLFAPTDEAFGLWPRSVIDSLAANQAGLSPVLQYHILSGVHTAADLLATPPVTLSGLPLSIAPQGDGLTVNGATVLAADTMVAGGVIHAIDRVLLPPPAEGVRLPAIDDSGVSVFVGTSLTIVGTAEPGRTILVAMNNEPFGQPATVAADGTWLVGGDVTPGDYQIVAYMLDATGGLEAISPAVALTVSGQ